MQKDTFGRLVFEGDVYQSQDQMALAAGSYRIALQTGKGTEYEQLEVKQRLGRCLLFLGSIPEAVELFHEVYVRAHGRKDWFHLAYRAFYDQVLNSRAMIEIEQDFSDLDRHLATIEEGLAWLRREGNERLGGPLLTEKAIACSFKGAYRRAFDIAEEAYALARDYGAVGYRVEYAGMIAARFARKSGAFDRADQLMKGIESTCDSSYTRVQILTEKTRLLMAWQPVRSSEALDQARILSLLLPQLSTTRAVIEGYIEIANCTLQAGYYAEAVDALQHVFTLAHEDRSHHRKYLCRVAKACFSRSMQLLAEEKGTISRTIEGQIREWDNELGVESPLASPI